MNIEYVDLHIEELVLQGFEPKERYRIARATERELRQLFNEQGIPTWLARGGEIAHLEGGTFEVARGSRTAAIGAQVAQAIYGGLSQ